MVNFVSGESTFFSESPIDSSSEGKFLSMGRVRVIFVLVTFCWDILNVRFQRNGRVYFNCFEINVYIDMRWERKHR